MFVFNGSIIAGQADELVEEQLVSWLCEGRISTREAFRLFDEHLADQDAYALADAEEAHRKAQEKQEEQRTVELELDDLLFFQATPGAEQKPAHVTVAYWMCEDWLIYGKGSDGRTYWVSTELWPAWADLPEDADQEEGSIEKYMLPLARQRWDSLRWQTFDAEIPEHLLNLINTPVCVGCGVGTGREGERCHICGERLERPKPVHERG